MSWRAQGRPGALGVLMTLCLTLLLAAGQAPYDWAWSRGQHATPAQWKAHARYEQRGQAHHGPADSVSSTERDAIDREATQTGTWLQDGTHDAHQAAPDGAQANTDSARELRPGLTWWRLAPLPVPLPLAPTVGPPIQPPRVTS